MSQQRVQRCLHSTLACFACCGAGGHRLHSRRWGNIRSLGNGTVCLKGLGSYATKHRVHALRGNLAYRRCTKTLGSFLLAYLLLGIINTRSVQATGAKLEGARTTGSKPIECTSVIQHRRLPMQNILLLVAVGKPAASKEITAAKATNSISQARCRTRPLEDKHPPGKSS